MDGFFGWKGQITSYGGLRIMTALNREMLEDIVDRASNDGRDYFS